MKADFLSCNKHKLLAEETFSCTTHMASKNAFPCFLWLKINRGSYQWKDATFSLQDYPLPHSCGRVFSCLIKTLIKNLTHYKRAWKQKIGKTGFYTESGWDSSVPACGCVCSPTPAHTAAYSQWHNTGRVPTHSSIPLLFTLRGTTHKHPHYLQ